MKLETNHYLGSIIRKNLNMKSLPCSAEGSLLQIFYLVDKYIVVIIKRSTINPDITYCMTYYTLFWHEHPN